MEFSKGSEKSIIGLLVVTIAFVLFLVFYNNMDNITANNSVGFFMPLMGLGLGLLLVFFFLVCNRLDKAEHHHKKASVSASRKPSKHKKKK